MSKVKIKLVTIGHLPIEFHPHRILSWKSSVFEVVGEIDNYALRCDSDGIGWEFSDELIRQQLPENTDANFTLAIVGVPIQDNWYSRRLGGNKIVFTFHEIKNILEHYNIPLDNIILRGLYAYALLYKRCGNRIPSLDEKIGFTHDETRGCLFDFNGIKYDIVASCHRPIICDECQERLRGDRVSNDVITKTQKEIKNIQRDLYYSLAGFIKKHPICFLVISSLFALLLGIAGSLVASLIYEKIAR